MNVNLQLKRDEKLYHKLKALAGRDPAAVRQLELLHETLKTHRITEQPQHEVCAEAILRLLLLEEKSQHQLSPDPKDGKMMALWGLVQHYQKLLDDNGLTLQLPN